MHPGSAVRRGCALFPPWTLGQGGEGGFGATARLGDPETQESTGTGQVPESF